MKKTKLVCSAQKDFDFQFLIFDTLAIIRNKNFLKMKHNYKTVFFFVNLGWREKLSKEYGTCQQICRTGKKNIFKIFMTKKYF